MRKFICMFALLIGLVAMQSCKESFFGVTYSLDTTGDVTGDVQLNYPYGFVGVNGDAELNMRVSNDTVLVFGSVAEEDVVPLGAALESNDEQELVGATAVNGWFNDNFSVDVNDADATYYFHIVGRIRENLTGLTFSVDKEFTNRPPNTEVAVVD